MHTSHICRCPGAAANSPERVKGSRNSSSPFKVTASVPRLSDDKENHDNYSMNDSRRSSTSTTIFEECEESNQLSVDAEERAVKAETEIARLLALNAELSERAAAADDMITSTEAEVDAIEQGKDDAEARAVKAERELSVLQDKMTSYHGNAEEAEEEIATLRQQVKEAVAPLVTAVAERLASQEMTQKLLCKCDALEKVIIDLEASTAVQLSDLAMEAVSAKERAAAACKELIDVKEATATEISRLHKGLQESLLSEEELSEALDEAEIVRIEERAASEEYAKVSAESFILKDGEIKELGHEIDSLKKYLEAAHECVIAAEERQEETQAEITELQARLAIAAQELTVQQRSINQMISEERERLSACATDDQDSLMVEMNALLESKIEAETRACKAESDAKDLQHQLSVYDRNTAKEQEIIMKTAESQMESLRQEREERAEALRLSYVELDETRQRASAATASCNALEIELSERQEIVEELEGALNAAEQSRDTAMRTLQESETKLSMTISAAKKAVSVAEEARDAAISALHSSGNNLLSEKAAMFEALSVKDQRIAHLEMSKLTQEQMDKIKLLKEEHKKSREDVKTMKKQLTLLKKAYDELKDSSVMGASSTDCVALIEAQNTVAVLNAKLSESVTRMEGTQNIAKALKEKIKDCSKQLQVSHFFPDDRKNLSYNCTKYSCLSSWFIFLFWKSI